MTTPTTSNLSAFQAVVLAQLAPTAATHARIHGWTVMNVAAANKPEKSAPALEISRPGDRVIKLWCRGDGVEISKGTQEWIDHFEGCGCECIVMRPDNALEVAERLARTVGWTPPKPLTRKAAASV